MRLARSMTYLVIAVRHFPELDRLREAGADAVDGYAFLAVGDGELEIERGGCGAV